jgi:hypothetical protein
MTYMPKKPTGSKTGDSMNLTRWEKAADRSDYLHPPSFRALGHWFSAGVWLAAVLALSGCFWRPPSRVETPKVQSPQASALPAEIPAASGGLPLTLAPQARTVAVGETFAVDLLLHTFGRRIDGVDIASLRYPTALLAVVDDDPVAPGGQITAGPLMPVTVVNRVDPEQGTVTLAQLAAGGSAYANNRPMTFATVHFVALQPGVATVTVDAVSGDTTDSNVVFSGQDWLSGVPDGRYTIVPGSSVVP